MPIRLVGLGAGGHAVSLLDAIFSSGQFDVVALVDSDPERAGGELLGVPVLGAGDLGRLRDEADAAFVGVGGIEAPGPRVRAFELLREAGFELPAIVHARASVSPWAVLGAGVQVLAGAIVNAGAAVEQGAILNTGAIVEHDCRVGAHAHVAPGATLGGDAIVGPKAHVGIGAVVLQGVEVGAGALVAAGAVVIRDVAPGERVAGVPARPL
jgi:sugar O-acyltransferase (sialic acid O-acetyltransferase NeuD family)